MNANRNEQAASLFEAAFYHQALTHKIFDLLLHRAIEAEALADSQPVNLGDTL